MAALSLGHLCHHKHNPILATSNPRTMAIISCQNRNPSDNDNNEKTDGGAKEGKGMKLQKLLFRVGKGLQDNLSPQKKGDWKDLTLMSLSFAVYIYMSQKIVCAYCAWMSMAGQSW